MKTSEYLELGRKYSRADLQKSFDIEDQTIKSGIFKPKGHSSIWLFITQENSRSEYVDEIVGNKLRFSGQWSHRWDESIVEHQANDDELILFYRPAEKGPFKYCGRAEYIAHRVVPEQPTQFDARLLDGRLNNETGEFVVESTQDTVKEKVRFVADTHLIQVLGEQLIASEKVGILELIRNAYDAGATTCKVWIENVPIIGRAQVGSPANILWSDDEVAKLPGPVITIFDDGHGMDYGTLVNGWLRPATTIKTSMKERVKEERKKADARGTRESYERMLNSIKQANYGRFPVGEKGVGRFATHRLGRYLKLNTKTSEDQREWQLTVDWAEFDRIGESSVDLSSIRLDLVHQPTTLDYGLKCCGTRLRIYGGRAGFDWNTDTLRGIAQAIAYLRSPAKKPEGFEPELVCPQLADTIEIPTNSVPAPFRCTALVENTGNAILEIELSPPASLDVPIPAEKWTDKIDLRTRDLDYWRSREIEDGKTAVLRQPECGPFFVDIKCWIRRGVWIEAPDKNNFTQYLDDFGGIGIFRNGLAIVAAEEGSRVDWLGLEKEIIKRGKNISYYNLVGTVEISQEENPKLIDKTSREGMLQTIPYHDLSVLVKAVVKELGFKVIETRDREDRLRLGPSIPKATLNKQIRITEHVLDAISQNYDFKRDSAGLLKVFEMDRGQDPEDAISVVKDLKKASNELRHEVDRLEEQTNALLEVAGFAISIGVALHEIEKITYALYQGLTRMVKLAKPGSDVYERARDLSRIAQGLLNELRRIAPLRVTRLEKRYKFSVRDAITAASAAFQYRWNDEEIEFLSPTKKTDFDVFGSFGACSQVFANLFDNATYWLQQIDHSGRKITALVDSEKRQVLVADSGPGISESIREHLFEPFYSLKSPPSGLGLYICRYYMRQMKGGNIREAKQSERAADFSGAQFVVVFPPTLEEK